MKHITRLCLLVLMVLLVQFFAVQAIGWVRLSVIPLAESHEMALLLALISTGRVIKLKRVVRAKRPMPIQRSPGNTLMNMTPARSTH